MMNAWIIEPRDSLIVRDGRPFGLGSGREATSLDFPFPSTTTGGVRTRAGLDHRGIFDSGLIEAVRQIGVYGPLLVELNKAGEVSNWLMPAPSDALIVRVESDEKKANIKRLAPIDVPPILTNLENDLLPVGVGNPLKGKPVADAPRYWYWDSFIDWLIEAKDSQVEPLTLGHGGPEKDSRVHVSIGDSLTAGDGELFQTRGLEFRRVLADEKLKDTKRLSLVVFVEDNAQAQNIKSGLAPLGGERRLVMWREDTSDKANEIGHCPDEIKREVIGNGHCRLLLLTPAFFQKGFYPEWLLQTRYGVTPELRAIANSRHQVVSGWDLAKISVKNGKTIVGEPKPTRRLVPSGSVLFLKLDGDSENIGKWVEETWFSCISDDHPKGEQDFRKDGYGLSMLGNWDGKLLRME